jgi:threonine/homoserine/homoserine lactone efflux protein
MDAALVVRGIVIGFSIAAPVGPIGVLCIRRTLADGRASGLLTGLGAATADAVYGAIAALGLTALTDALVGGQNWIRLIGGAFLLYLGVRTFLAKPSERAAEAPREEEHSGRGRASAGALRRRSASGHMRLVSAFVSTFVLTLTNPMTILSFVAVFAALGLGTTHPDPLSAAGLVLGVFVGSALWWLTLSGAVSLFRSRFDERGLVWVNRVSGAVITAFGLAAAGSLLFRS